MRLVLIACLLGLLGSLGCAHHKPAPVTSPPATAPASAPALAPAPAPAPPPPCDTVPC